MSGFIVGADRNQTTLLPESLDDYVAEEGAVRVIDVFVDELELAVLGFKTTPADTGRPGYHPATMLKLFIYGASATLSIDLSKMSTNARRRSERFIDSRARRRA